MSSLPSSDPGAPATTFRPTDAWLAGVVLAVLTYWLFAQTLLAVNPVMAKDLALQPQDTTLAIAVTALVGGICIVIGGGIADRIGRARVFHVGIVLSIIGSLLIMVTPPGAAAVAMLMTGRVVQGLSYACVMPTALALLKDWYDGPARQRAISWFSIGTFGGSGLTAFFGGAIVGTPLGWRGIFALSAIVAAVALLLTRRTPNLVQAAPGGTRAPFDIAGIISFALMLGCLDVAIVEGAALGWTSAAEITLIVVTVVAAAAFFAVESRKGRAAFIDLAMFRNTRFSGPTLANFTVNGMVAAIMVTSTVAQKGGGLSATQAGLLTLGYVIAILLMIRVGEKLLQRFGPKKPMTWGTLIVGTGVLLLGTVFLPFQAWLIAAVLGYTCFGIGLGFFATPATDAAISSVSAAESGVASGIFKMGSSLGGSIGIAVAGTLVALGGATKPGDVPGFLTRWSGTSAPIQYGALLGYVFLVVCAVISLVAIAVTVPAGRREDAAAEPVAVSTR